MNLNPIKANMTELSLKGGLTVLFSYRTPVACKWTDGLTSYYYKTDKKWSATTTRHINYWVEKGVTDVKSQEYFDNLIKEVA
jgi:hypothetical protein